MGVDSKAAKAVEVELVMVQDFFVEMSWILDIVGTVGMDMVLDIVVGIVVGIFVDTFVEVVGFHNYILSILVQVGFDIVVEPKPAMTFGCSMNFEEDIDSFFKEIVEESLVAKVFLVPHSKDHLPLVLLPLDSFSILSALDSFLLNGFLCKGHILEYYPEDILLMMFLPTLGKKYS